MTSIQEFCASTGRTLEASPPMAVAGQPLTWVDSAPWQRIESPEPSAVIYVDPGAHRDGFSPNAVATCARVAPAMSTDDAVAKIVATAEVLPDWTLLEEVAGEGDEDAGAVRSIYRFVRGTYTAEPGQMATSSLIVGWSDDEATYVFQLVVTGWREDAGTQDSAMDCLLIGEWSAAQIVEAMRG
ncbi:LpqN/LpqT family lipoprotein [Dietzia sp. PP-33]|uniref:LpqN/LpqT family lipoprotein n=1 Tax=Dietzia sp. PP-33 TaxID=2957500 RepID=UPI00299FAF34|nr:LpqN/LpqT family lipoprotein [Dietzia sp. PP-33]MDX2359075.1 LpqN/LpqT family lipoprotein [Dietzia sp. PP-33]